MIRTRLEHVSDESGFTLIELLVAATILVLGIFGLVTSVETSHKLSDVSERETSAAQVADRELDLALTVPYKSVALSSLPANGGPTDDGTQWNNWLAGAVPHPSTAFTCSSASAANSNPADPNDERDTSCIAACATVNVPTGCPAPGRLAAVSTVLAPAAGGTVRKLKVYRYVTWVNDLACGANCPNPPANGYKGDYKRVTIAVLPVLRSVTDTTGVSSSLTIDGPKKPVVVSAVRNDPASNGGGQPSSLPPCGIQGVQC